MITEDYCSYEVAKLLEEKGFDILVWTRYEGNDEVIFGDKYNWNNSPMGQISAPTHQMARKWLREVYNLFVQITVDFSDGVYPMYDVCVVNLAICTSIVVNGYNRYSYKEAVEAALKYLLENLI